MLEKFISVNVLTLLQCQSQFFNVNMLTVLFTLELVANILALKPKTQTLNPEP